MKNITPIIGLLLAIIGIGMGLFWLLAKEVAPAPTHEQKKTSSKAENDFAVEVDWGLVPAGVELYAWRSDWEDYAFGQGSIVVYDFRAQALSKERPIEALKMDFALLYEVDKPIRQYHIDTTFDHLQAQDVISINWRFQDTIPAQMNPLKTRVSNINLRFRDSAQLSSSWPIEPLWAGSQPKNVDFSFESRAIIQKENGPLDTGWLVFSFATYNQGRIPIEYLQIKIEAFDQEDNLLFSASKKVIDDYDAPMQAKSSRLSLLKLKPSADFKLASLAYFKFTVLEADY
ncbi:MAG: hypothetical protein AAF927_13835 [Bacteroidota bacterium]